jgi:hypothetical protein
MKNDLFDETFVLIDCVLRNKIFIIAMINIDVIEYAFIDESIAQSLCKILKIESVQLIKKRLIKVYDERKDQVIIHVIYSKMIIQEHTKNLTFMLIIRLEQQTFILEKSWMRKHEISYHEKTNIIEFFSEFCTHSKRIKTKTTSSSNKEKNIPFEKKSFLNQSDHSKFDDSIKNSRESKKIVTKTFNSKEKLLEVNIAMIEASAFNMMNKRKNVNLFFVTLKDVEKHLEKHSKSNIVIKNVLSIEYHEFLDVCDKKTFNILVSHRFYDHKIVLKKDAVFEYTSLYKMFEEKLKIIKKYLENNLKKRFIAASRSSFVSLVMFMKKTNESLKFCVDYRKLNQLTKKNRYSLSFIDETLAHLEKSNISRN